MKRKRFFRVPEDDLIPGTDTFICLACGCLQETEGSCAVCNREYAKEIRE